MKTPTVRIERSWLALLYLFIANSTASWIARDWGNNWWLVALDLFCLSYWLTLLGEQFLAWRRERR